MALSASTNIATDLPAWPAPADEFYGKHATRHPDGHPYLPPGVTVVPQAKGRHREPEGLEKLLHLVMGSDPAYRVEVNA